MPTNQQEHHAKHKGKAGISMLGFDHDFWGRMTPAAGFTLCILALITMFIVLGLVALHSWEAESLLHCSPWSSPSSPCGGFIN
jgi:hypothetical protein